jgi:hypothetical protein
MPLFGIQPFNVAAPYTFTVLPQTVNLYLYRGDSYAMKITVTDTAGDPADLEGVDVCAQIRVTADDPNLAGEYVTTVTDNSVFLYLPATVSRTLPLDTVWDCELTQPSGWVTTVAAGSLNLTADVSRCWENEEPPPDE